MRNSHTLIAAFYKHIRAAFKKIFDYRGCSGRAEFWCFFLLYLGYFLILKAADYLGNYISSEDMYYLGNTETASVICQGIAFGIDTILYLTLFSVTVRRLRDAGFAFWWVLPYLVLTLTKYTVPQLMGLSHTVILTRTEDGPTSIFVSVVICSLLQFMSHLLVLVLCLYKSRPEAPRP